ncbi:macro domain protein [Pestalotiopsis sp. NC0098]|nr:macro domain protein [Pestalotiopsis sp. NC0098]
MMESAPAALRDALSYLLGEGSTNAYHQVHRRGQSWDDIKDDCVDDQLELLRQLLIARPVNPELPDSISQSISAIYDMRRSRRSLTSIESLKSNKVITTRNQQQARLFLWRGDITALSGVTAIVNAANSQMLGCFKPTHRCIDNVIHSWAGPELRSECYNLTSRATTEVPPGHSLTTRGHHLPAPYVIHTVGPKLRRGSDPTSAQRQRLTDCYTSILEELEKLPATNGRRAVAMCCISTGVFAYPADKAAQVAVDTVSRWLQEHDTKITDVIFNTFTKEDTAICQDLLVEP